MIKYIIKYAEAFEMIKHLEGKASDCKRGEHDNVASIIGNSDYGTYYDTKGYVTAGIGHKLTDAELMQYVGKPKVKEHWDNLTEEQANELFVKDFLAHVDKALDLTPELDDLPINVASQIISATFRGSWGLSEEARQLFSQCKYKEAAAEFLNSNEYHTTKSAGIKKRMEDVADAIHQLDGKCMSELQDTARSTVEEETVTVVDSINSNYALVTGYVVLVLLTTLALVKLRKVI